MAAIAGGLGAAVIWSVGTAFASRATRALGPVLTLAWVMLISFVALVLVLPLSGSSHISGSAVIWLALGGAGNVAGLLLMYRAMRIGQIGVVVPIVATEGGIAAVLSIIAGQPITAVASTALVLTVVGVMMTALARRPSEPPVVVLPEEAALAQAGPRPDGSAMAHEPGPDGPGSAAPQFHPKSVPTPRGHGDRRAAVFASIAALSMGISLFATGKAGTLLPAAWAVMPPRVIGVLFITIPLAVRGRLRWVRGTGHLVVVAGICEIGGFLSYALGARHDIAVAAVLAGLSGAISVGIGRVLFGERLQFTQILGVAAIFVGVATLSAVTA